MHTEGVRKVVHLVQGWALQAALKAADVGSTGDEAEVFLRQSLRVACFPQSCSEVVSGNLGGLHP